MNSTDLLVAMHGAGVSHLAHLPLGDPNCCGVIEIFPASEWTPARGYGNMARRLGFHHDRLDFKSTDMSCKKPSDVPTSKLKEIVAKMMVKLHSSPSCILPVVINDFFLKQSVPDMWSWALSCTDIWIQHNWNLVLGQGIGVSPTGSNKSWSTWHTSKM